MAEIKLTNERRGVNRWVSVEHLDRLAFDNGAICRRVMLCRSDMYTLLTGRLIDVSAWEVRIAVAMVRGIYGIDSCQCLLGWRGHD